MKRFAQWLGRAIVHWLIKDGPPAPSPLCDFNRLRYELRPGDIVLAEGRSRVSDVIKVITQSSWTHSGLYLGRLHDIEDPETRERVREFHHGEEDEQLVLEALLGEGTIISPLTKYHQDHLRICRPNGLAPADAQRIIRHCARRLGTDYDVRQLFDLARFFVPWAFLPRRWRSSLFQHNAGGYTRTVCSSLIAEAFNKVDFPILPFIDRGEDGSLRFFKRNPRLFTPRDFDYSPYFDIIKYPFLGLNDLGIYRRLPWNQGQVIYNDEAHAFEPDEADTPAEDDHRVTTPKVTPLRTGSSGGRK
ncbi:MAG: YiiX/YebB-like N1pC/P60 family cysteine hydrolase [Pseudomonadota bacterium]